MKYTFLMLLLTVLIMGKKPVKVDLPPTEQPTFIQPVVNSPYGTFV